MHMNHGPDFWKYYRTLHAEVKALQRAKYFGDGMTTSVPEIATFHYSQVSGQMVLYYMTVLKRTER
jgi:hypothetical protein